MRAMVSKNSPLTTFGASASAGKSTSPTAASTSASAFCISVPNSNSTCVVARPSKEEELTFFTLAMVRNSGSSVCTILASISSAVAPDQSTLTATTSTSISGKNCLFRRAADMLPTTSIRIMMILAAVLCRAKNSTALPNMFHLIP